ncbi:10224_t:CDS:10 [Diversispora eburnea]|uniref:10224_t:CDS:1 n=1 Tax=Diversispora eburnea TaxID=1213867 RepID=A0A9N8VZ41_9GLOM|nr:10224_t:CDS:10 [Diversispora eburnea]
MGSSKGDDQEVHLSHEQEFQLQALGVDDNHAESSRSASIKTRKHKFDDEFPEDSLDTLDILDILDDTNENNENNGNNQDDREKEKDRMVNIDNQPNKTKTSSSQSWTEKYRPKHYTDLVGDENVNRDIMKWLIQWNYCVFGKKEATYDGKINGKNGLYQDKWNRPEKKILMLTGPPGYGKTTLAHVVARHCGYDVLEINASDDRTGQVIKSKITNALEIHSINQNKKPILIIIDEIDGVSSNLIDIEKPQSSNSAITKKGMKGIKTNKKQKNIKRKHLLRPIICICNDQYAPVLRPLRNHVKVVQLKKSNTNRLTKRLMQICERENLSADMSALFFLTESTEGDLRNCLTILQNFNKSLFAIWEEIFMLKSARNKFSEKNHIMKYSSSSGDLLNNNNSTQYVEHLASVINSNGDYDKLFQANSQQSFELLCYAPYPLINFYRLFAGSVRPYIDYPKRDYENYVAKQANENLIACSYNGIPSHYRVKLNKNLFPTELISYLMRIIYSNVENVEMDNTSMLPSNTKLSRVVDIMIFFNLKFVQKRMDDGKVLLKLEPPIDDLILSFRNLPKKMSLISREKSKQPKISNDIKTNNGLDFKIINAPKIWYIHHEGTSRAVRTKLKLRDFL